MLLSSKKNWNTNTDVFIFGLNLKTQKKKQEKNDLLFDPRKKK